MYHFHDIKDNSSYRAKNYLLQSTKIKNLHLKERETLQRLPRVQIARRIR